MSLPSPAIPAARLEETVRKDQRPPTLVCPRCRTAWAEVGAPELCPTDGISLVKAKELAEADRDPMVGRTLEGRYTILSRLGSGSMGTVYRAKQHAMGREIAIKILRGDRAADETAKARFLREARANSLLASPNTVTVFDFGQSETGEFYLAMELLEGESLGQRLTRIGRLSTSGAVDTARQALRSLAEAHAKGIIHRDLKPDNLFFARVRTGGKHEEIVKVLDFGIAKLVSEHDEAMGVVETQAGTVFGTPRYMSPEQAQGKPLDARTDLYSLGVILFQMLTGRPPFTDNDAVVVMARHIKSIPKRPSEAAPDAQIPRELEDVVMRALSKSATDRQTTADDFSNELLAAIESTMASTSGVRSSVASGPHLPDSRRPPPVSTPSLAPVVQAPRRPTLLYFVAPIVLVLCAMGVYFGMRRSTPRPDPFADAIAARAAHAAEEARIEAAAKASAEAAPPKPIEAAALPSATTTASNAKPSHARPGRPVPAPPPKTTGSARPASPSAAPSSSSPYGVFD